MLILDYSSQFKKDFKKITKLPIPEIIEVGNVISTLQKGLILESNYVDHALVGNWHEFRDCWIITSVLPPNYIRTVSHYHPTLPSNDIYDDH